MARTHEGRMARAISRDGTEIGYFTSGEGPPLVLVHGGVGDHARWSTLLPYLEPHRAVHALDRRGRGASGDSPDWSMEREYEDVAAVVDAVAENSGSTVDVYGHSGGGFCAFAAAARTSNIRRLVLYEGWPPVDPDAIAPPLVHVERMEELLAEGNREAVVEMIFRDLTGASEEDLDDVRRQPSWPARIAAAHTVPRELRAFRETPFDPEQAAAITVRTLLLTGTEGPDWGAETVAAYLPDARVVVLEGQGHSADLLAPEMVAEQVLSFLRAP